LKYWVKVWVQEWYGWVGRVSWDFCCGVVIGGVAGKLG
jgi:hypothetical protein